MIEFKQIGTRWIGQSSHLVMCEIEQFGPNTFTLVIQPTSNVAGKRYISYNTLEECKQYAIKWNNRRAEGKGRI